MEINANTQLYDNVLNRAAMIRLYEQRVHGKVSLVLDGHIVRLDTLIKDAKATTAGMARLREAVDLELRKTYKEVFQISKRSLLDLAADQVSFAYQNVEVAMGSIWRTQRPTRRVAEEIVLERPLHQDRTLAQGWSGVAAGERQRIEAIIRAGVARGDTLGQLALAVRKGNVHSITRNQAEALVTTAVTSVHNQADHEVYKANSKALVGWQYIAVLDSRTTELCAHRDGTIYPIGDVEHLPPAHYRCRSTTVPVFKSWSDLAKLEGVSEVRRRNLNKLSAKQIAFYDGQTPLRETYNDWLKRQPTEVQLQHLGDYKKIEMLRNGQVTVDKFVSPSGKSIGIRELRKLSDAGYTAPNDTQRFANAKAKLDSMQLGASTPEDLINNPKLKKTLVDYYLLQAGELDGVLSNTNYRGTLLNTKSAAKRRVLSTPPTEDQLKFNPVTGRYEDTRMYQPNPAVFKNNMRLVRESDKLKDVDKQLIEDVISGLEDKMSINQRAVVADNLRIIISRFRSNGEVWGNLKAVIQSQIKFDVMNVSDYIETQLRKDSDLFKKLLQDNYIDPVLGPVQLQDLHDNFLSNITKKNTWENRTAPTIANELRGLFTRGLPVVIRSRLSDKDLRQFYLRFAHRLSMADGPDRDGLAASLGRDLYNLANLNGTRREWFDLGLKILNDPKAKKFYELETFGVQKRRMKSRLSANYFGPYYDTLSYNLRIVDPRIQEYAKLTRKVDLGLRVAVTSPKNRLIFREGYKTYFMDRGFGLEDTRIPITSTSSFSDFPEEFIDKPLVDALNWAATTEYKVDPDFYDFTNKLLNFEDDRGKAKYYSDLNGYRKYIASRGDAYERFKAMQWLRESDSAFSNQPFIDHRARIYERGLIGPQAGETFRPFLNTAASRKFSPEEFNNLQDQIGSFLGGLDDYFEGNQNSLSVLGRQAIAKQWRPELVRIGKLMMSAKPNDIRAILESEIVARIDGEELSKFFRLALESAKLDNYLDTTKSIVYQDRRPQFLHLINDDGSSVVSLNVNKLHEIAHTIDSEEIKIDDVYFMEGRRLSNNDKKKIAAANYQIPPLIRVIPKELRDTFKELEDKKYVFLDGFHRLTKAKAEGRTALQMVIIPEDAVQSTVMTSWQDIGKEIKEAKQRPVLLRDTVVDKYSVPNLQHLRDYDISLALEQDASSSGAQIIALTTKNKQLAELSNVIPTDQKKRLYDEIAAATFNDPRFRALNERLNLTERDLRKAAKAQNMVECCHV